MNAQQHRLAQLRLGSQVVGLLHAAFRLLDPDDLDATFSGWLAVTTPIVHNSRRVSTQMAAAFINKLRLDHVGFDPAFSPQLAAALSDDLLRTSMLVTGPVAAKAAIGRGIPITRAMDIAEARSSAAAMRHVLNGGRETLVATVRADDRAHGWRRIASGRACKFCSSLEGMVVSEQNADFQAHDGCSCSAEPVYR